MRPILATITVLVVVSFAATAVQPAAAQSTIGDFDRGDLDDGTNDENEIEAPLFDANGMAPLYIGTIARQYDPEALMFQQRRQQQRVGRLGSRVLPGRGERRRRAPP